MKLFYTLILLFLCFSISSQTLTEKQKEREKNKVEIYTPDEKDNIQRWFYEATNKLELSETVRSEYNRILSDIVFDIRRLNDKDKDYSKTEIDTKFDALVKKANKEVKDILTKEQYSMHLENFGKLVRDVKVVLDKE